MPRANVSRLPMARARTVVGAVVKRPQRHECPGCGQLAQRWKKVQLVGPKGSQRAKVCPSCVQRSSLVVFKLPENRASCVECLKHDAVVCLACCIKAGRRRALELAEQRAE